MTAVVYRDNWNIFAPVALMKEGRSVVAVSQMKREKRSSGFSQGHTMTSAAEL